MALQVLLAHKTRYVYNKLVSLSPHVIRLRPAPHTRTPIESYTLKISPKKHFINWQQDPFGNYLARIVFPEKTKEFSFEVEIVADLTTINPFDFFIEEAANLYPFQYDDVLHKELIPYLEVLPKGPLYTQWISTLDTSPRKTIDFLIDLNRTIHQNLEYQIRMEPGVQTCEETLQKRKGSCRDFAWLLVQTLRNFGFGARFVSGYLVQLTADVKALDGPSGPEKDFTDLHAWAEVYIPGAGWIGLDSTSGLLAGEGHIPLACTPSFESAAPVTGYTDVCETEFYYSNTVTRLFESPRVTKPYTSEQWKEIFQLGFQVDTELNKGDVRLTMGGEPTFVSIDDMEAPEWNITADGLHKRALAQNLSRRLMSRFGKKGFLHHSQGKWYPGEPLPRWQISMYWRKDGRTIWHDPNLLASMSKTYTFEEGTAQLFLQKVAAKMGISQEYIHSAYEDSFYFLWEEGNLPLDVNPTKLNLKDSLVRQKLAEVLEVGMQSPVAWVLPIQCKWNGWATCKWYFRRTYIYLVPGNSPAGLRLPLASLKENPEVLPEPIFETDPFNSQKSSIQLSDLPENQLPKVPFHNVDSSIRTALCAEVREQKLFLFLPPLGSIEAYFELLSVIEAVAKELQVPVILEGYEPPHDNRVEKIKVTPDPGVIEVNIHPAQNWEELTANTLALYDEARLSRLGTEKFMVDGRHTGTGGGNHVTLGGVTPADSPLLRRPDLLQSLLTFWQHHPGLSYLFSGAFVGPTSQAPRIDEGRQENLYELEIAFSQIPKNQEVPFWLTDRLFRHLLTDITGNTHRSEFCIDKLYSPDSLSGRLGILELRAFDMPPHPHMSLVQMLLVRTLVAWFWNHPYQHSLVRWGTQLHDKFLMEHYVRQDLVDIVEQLNKAGYPFKVDWFNPFYEFRFPLYGKIAIREMEVEIRMAIEPWHVLGEEMTGRGTSRYVDSSLERIQIKVTNFVEERYLLTCNSIKVPLQSTGVKGEYVSGVRYKAWQPWSALHPTIPTDPPLVFDLVDKWNNRSIGGCVYYVSHPGGRSYDTFPVNSYEAESRRINRFWEFGHTPAANQTQNSFSHMEGSTRYIEERISEQSLEVQEIPINPEFPLTLDLRKAKK